MTQVGTVNGGAAVSVAFETRIAALLARAGISGGALSIGICSQGANNRIHRVQTANGVFAVKEYFRHADDPRDRLAAETAFLTYANDASPGTAPRLLASDGPSGLALLEFIPGRPIASGSVGAAQVDSAIAFFRDLNAPASRSAAQLPVAAEATFSIGEQLALIESRITQLLAVAPRSAADAASLDLARRLSALWAQLAGGIRGRVRREPLDDGADYRCVSPSDFGFHNALVTDAGRVRFIDFEYAGWDDFAKTAGDFFAQVAVPVPIEHFEHFVRQCSEVLPAPAVAARRAILMRPAYQVKWCCIALNVFLPVHLARRRFANPELDEDALKLAQVAKAERIMAGIAQDAH